MRALIQRALEGAVTVAGEEIARTGAGMVIFVCAMQGDGEADARRLAAKIARLRIFRDGEGRMNRSILDCGGEALVVSQFTLAADIRRGNRPSFAGAAPPELGERLYREFCAALRTEGLPVETGVFGARMKVRLINDGPVTIWMDSAHL